MKSDLLEKMRQLSAHEKVLAITVRIPVSLDAEIRELCEDEKLPLAVVIRELIKLGWEGFWTGDAKGENTENSA